MQNPETTTTTTPTTSFEPDREIAKSSSQAMGENVAGSSAQTAIQKKLYEGFNDARSRNPHVSLRAYARRLAVSPAALSEILRGKRRISMNRAKELISRMGMDPIESEKILNLFAQEAKGQNRKKLNQCN